MSTWCKSNINCAFSVSLCATSSGEKCLAKCSENYLPNLQPPPRLFTELYGEFQLVVQPPGPCDFTVLVTSLLQCHFQLQQTKPTVHNLSGTSQCSFFFLPLTPFSHSHSCTHSHLEVAQLIHSLICWLLSGSARAAGG